MTMNQLLSWGAAVVWMAVIFYLSHQVAAASSELSSGITAWILDSIQSVFPWLAIDQASLSFFVRKTAHFIAYLILGGLLLHAFYSSGVLGRHGFVFALGMSVLYAISDEVHQLFVPGRSGEVRDVLIDSAGALTGLLCYLFIMLLWRKTRKE